MNMWPLDLVGRIRGQKKFESVRQLVAAMGADTGGHVTCCLRVDGSCGRDPG